MKAAIFTLILTSWLSAQNLVITMQQWEIARDTEAAWVKAMQEEPDTVADKLREQAQKKLTKFHGMNVIQGSAECTLSLEQIKELIFVSDYEPPEVPPHPQSSITDDATKTDPVLEKLLLQGYQKASVPLTYFSVPTTFEPRNVGMTVECSARIYADDIISLRVEYEKVRLAGKTDYNRKNDLTKDIAHQFPLFAVERTSRKLQMKSGEWKPFALWQRNESEQSLIVLVRVDVM